MPYADPARQREYAREWVARRRAEWLEANGPCAECGSSDELEVDHVDPTTKVSHNVWSWSTARREAELAKCQALCVTCHRTKTSAESATEAPRAQCTTKEERRQRSRRAAALRAVRASARR